MIHDLQVKEYGECSCKCHIGKPLCTCGIPAKVRLWFSPPEKPRKLRNGKLTSRVKPFTKQRARISVIAITKEHGFHAVPLLKK